MIDLLAEPFGFQFFRNGIIVVTIAGALCGAVGTYVVLRGMSYIGHGLAHAIFGGAVASFIANINFYLGAGVWGLASALLVQRVARRRAIGADAAIGVVTTASFALGVALISRHRRFTQNFEAALFGNPLGVRMGDVIVVSLVAVAVALLITGFYRHLLFTTFDPDVAAVHGVNTARMDALLSLILAATIIATMRLLGVTLIAAAIVIPAAIARTLTDRFARMLWLATGIGAAGGLVGMYLSFYFDVATGASVVLLEAAVFLVTFVISGRSQRASRGSVAW